MKSGFSLSRFALAILAGSLVMPTALAVGAFWRYQGIPWRLILLGWGLNFLAAIPASVFAGIAQTSRIPFRAAAITGATFLTIAGSAISPRGDTMAAVWVSIASAIACFLSLLAGVLGSVAVISRNKPAQ